MRKYRPPCSIINHTKQRRRELSKASSEMKENSLLLLLPLSECDGYACSILSKISSRLVARLPFESPESTDTRTINALHFIDSPRTRNLSQHTSDSVKDSAEREGEGVAVGLVGLRTYFSTGEIYCKCPEGYSAPEPPPSSSAQPLNVNLNFKSFFLV